MSVRRKKKSNIIFSLILFLVCITIGYASLNSNLSINGISSINNSSWDIHFENIQTTTGSVTPNSAASISNATTINYAITLSKPGDFYEFTVDVVNDGTIDGMIESVISKLNGSVITTLPDYLEYYVKYSDGIDLANNHLLAAGEKETYKVHIGYKEDIQPNQLPSTDQSLSLSLSVNYIQSDNSATEVDHPIVRYTASVNPVDTYTYVIHLGQPIPANIPQYSSGADALAAIRTATNDDTISYYLKHVIQNGVVIESHVEFIITPEMVNDFPGMTAGTYSIQGGGSTYSGIDDYYLSDSIYYDTNKATLLRAFGSECLPEYANSEMQCLIPNMSPYIFRYGGVNVVGTYCHCEVNSDGSALCAYNDF